MSNFWSKTPLWSGVLPDLYSFTFSLDRLLPGVDNINIDVSLSPDFYKAASSYAFLSIVSHAHAGALLKISSTDIGPAKEEFKRLCQIVLLEAINRAKQEDADPQIDLLAQVAMVKLLVEEVRNQFDLLQHEFNNKIWEYEVSRRRDIAGLVKLKEKLSDIRRGKKGIIGHAGRDVLGCLHDIQQGDIKKIREANFGGTSILPEDILVNPLLYMGEFPDDFFMLREYVLLGRRSEDANTFESVLGIVRGSLDEIDLKDTGAKRKKTNGRENALPEAEGAIASPVDSGQLIDGWIKQIETFDIFLNYQETHKRLREARGEKESPRKIQQLKKQFQEQKSIAKFFCRRFKKAGLLDSVVASHEMKDIYRQYCPPLSPQEVLQYLIVPGSRKRIIAHLKRIKRYYGQGFSLSALRKTTSKIRWLSVRKRHEHLRDYLRSFARYFRDLQNYRMLKEVMGRLHLVTDEKLISLSRANNTLYEFLLPHEDLFRIEEKPVTGHVIIKTDVRGATTITRQLQEKGLNTATYFSLNFFEPIFGILPEYGAMKVFIEGDAIILAILEHKDMPSEWYSVARACGLAVSMLKVIRRYNATCIKHNLPVLEVGSGICYQAGSPTYLLDGDTQIMISPAINQADRLSGNTKQLSKHLADSGSPFNLHVFEKLKVDRSVAEYGDEEVIRYNVNGIELSETGFAKLSSEIKLTAVKTEIVGVSHGKVTLHVGKFPTVTGKYQRIIIREASIPLVEPDTFKISGQSGRRYYEVCTDPGIYKYAQKMA